MDREKFLSSINKIISNSEQTAGDIGLGSNATNEYVDKNIITFVHQVAGMQGINKGILDLVIETRPNLRNAVERSFPGVLGLGVEFGARNALNSRPAYSNSGCGSPARSSGNSCGGSPTHTSSGCGSSSSPRPSSSGCGNSSHSSGSSCGGSSSRTSSHC